MIDAIQQNIDLSTANTFGLKAQAQHYYALTDLYAFKEDLPALQTLGLPLFVLGGGSNILFTQQHFPAVVIHNQLRGIHLHEDNNDHVIIRAAAGEPWHEFVLYCLDQDLSGIENLSLIPGLIGAAPIQNIGAYGVELKDVFVSLKAINLANGEALEFQHEQCDFGYRDSVFKRQYKNKLLITEVSLRLNKTEHLHLDYAGIRDQLTDNNIANPSAKDVSDAVIAIRQRKLPNPAEIGNAGSFFKNPVISLKQYEQLQRQFNNIPAYNLNNEQRKVPAAWLIDYCGFKGQRFDNIGVHTNQPLVLVNYGDGNGNAIAELAKHIQQTVKDTFNIELEAEVNIV